MRLGVHRRQLALFAVLVFGSCTPPPPELGEARGTLTPCLRTACVHTGMRHPDGVRGMVVTNRMSHVELRDAVRELVTAMPRTEIVADSGLYLRAEIDYLIPGRTDDLEILIAVDREIIVRSAARGPLTDFGANLRRVEELRSDLVEAGILR